MTAADAQRVETEVMNAYYARDPEALLALIRRLLAQLQPPKGTT